MKRSLILLPLACSIAIAGCDQEPASVPPTIEHVAYANTLTNGTYEVQLRYSITSSGGPCFNKDFFKTWTSHETNWVFLNALVGSMAADQIIVRAGVKDKVGDFTYPIKGLRGTISFDKDMMRVQLEQPHVLPSGAVQGYVPYSLNGTYQVVSK